MNTFKIYTTIDALGGRSMCDGWTHGRIIKGQWVELEYSTKEIAQRALDGPQFNGRGAYATNGEKRLHRSA